jgi:hypothetical protein
VPIFLNSENVNLLELSWPVQVLLYLNFTFVALELSKLAKKYGFYVHSISWPLSEGGDILF